MYVLCYYNFTFRDQWYQEKCDHGCEPSIRYYTKHDEGDFSTNYQRHCIQGKEMGILMGEYLINVKEE